MFPGFVANPPLDFGRRSRFSRGVTTPPIPRFRLGALKGGDADQNAAALESILAGEPGPRGDAVAVNAGAALYVAGLAEGLNEGVASARELLRSGAGLERLQALREAAS